MIHRTEGTSEDGVKQVKEVISKFDLKGTIGGFYKKRGATATEADVKGIYG